MHDTKTVAFEIYLGSKIKRNGQYRNPVITIWHNDPETDGTDDSCGWFMRPRHGDPEMLNKIKSAIESDFDRTYVSESNGTLYLTGYFTPITGAPVMSVHGIVLNMFSAAAWQYFKFDRKRHNKWMKENLYDILHFAENPTDSLRDDVLGIFRRGCGENWNRDESLNNYARIIYGWILRKTRKWYQHPRWHFHHWSIQIHPLQKIKRRFWDKCSKCGKRGFKGSAIGDWYGTKIWHQQCDDSFKNPPTGN
ncbi:hypothetical protein ACFS6H_20030 [Terrimonas rubra]|uniref:Uncharacterized protein n=1 Tax=Terrimonas rubra TaxID=1035890 RepID=A0ABW6A9J6_9BACT